MTGRRRHFDQFSFNEFVDKAVIRHCQQLISGHECYFSAHSSIPKHQSPQARVRPPQSRQTEVCRTSQILFNLPHNFSNLEWSALNLRESNGINQILRTHHGAELAQIHLRNNYGFKSGEHFTEILRKGIQMTKMRRRNALAFALKSFDRRAY